MKIIIMFDEQFVVEPPKPIKKTEYYCDKIFHVDSILKLYERPNICGLIFINGEHCQLFTVDVTNNDKVKCGNVNTYLKQHHKGGSSSARFGRLHDEKVIRYLKDISEEVRTTFADVDKIVVGGISTRPDQLIPYLHTDVSKKIIGHVVMTQFDSQVVSKLIDLCNKFESENEMKALKHFSDAVEGQSNGAVPIYGEDDIKNYLEMGLISKLYICSKICGVNNQLDVNIYKKICEEIGTDIIEVGISQKAQELANMFGPIFGIAWSYVKI